MRDPVAFREYCGIERENSNSTVRIVMDCEVPRIVGKAYACTNGVPEGYTYDYFEGRHKNAAIQATLLNHCDSWSFEVLDYPDRLDAVMDVVFERICFLNINECPGFRAVYDYREGGCPP